MNVLANQTPHKRRLGFSREVKNKRAVGGGIFSSSHVTTQRSRLSFHTKCMYTIFPGVCGAQMWIITRELNDCVAHETDLTVAAGTSIKEGELHIETA